MKSTTIIASVLLLAALAVCAAAMAWPGDNGPAEDGSSPSSDSTTTDDTDKDDTTSDDDDSSSAETDEYTVSGLTITYTSGTSCHTVTTVDGETVITFSGTDEDVECALAGTLNGSIIIEIGEEAEFKLVLAGVTITSYSNAPIVATSADKLTISAKNGTTNTVNDLRDEVTDDSEISSAIYSTCDMDVQGRGSLTVYSENNNGIHSKDDLSVKNLTLSVDCIDNALKGNDSVTIESGTISLTARQGDGIKTTNTETKTKDDGTIKQKGIVRLCSDEGALSLTISAMYDGIDAAYGLEIEQTSYSLTVEVYTGSYAGYSTGSVSTGSVTTGAAPGGPGGWMPDGNPDGWDDRDDSDSPSAKGLKAETYIIISSGTIVVSSEDDSVHCNGTVTVSGGKLTLCTGDDGIHADGALTITGGTIRVSECYEGIEGDTISVSGGDIVVISEDDGFNSTGTSGTGISISGGTILIRAGGDGLDSNSYTSYQGLVMTGGDVIVISNGPSDSAIDTERGYTFSGGRLLGICLSGDMANSECVYCSNFSSIGKAASMRVTSGQYVTASVGGSISLAVEMDASFSAYVVYLGSSSATISTASSVSGADSDGVYRS